MDFKILVRTLNVSFHNKSNKKISVIFVNETWRHHPKVGTEKAVGRLISHFRKMNDIL